MQQAGCHQANSLATKISTDIQDQLTSRDTQLLAMLQNLTSQSGQAPLEEQENILPNQVAAHKTSNR